MESLIPPVFVNPGPSSILFNSSHQSELLWGTYRPQVYSGMRMRAKEDALFTGLMWYEPKLNPINVKNRHIIETNNIVDFKWLKHDGRRFGKQILNDTDLGIQLNTSFIKFPGEFGGDWIMKITCDMNPDLEMEKISLLYYVALENRKNGRINLELPLSNTNQPLSGPTIISGYTPLTGNYSMIFLGLKKQIRKGTYYTGFKAPEEWRIYNHLRITSMGGTGRAQLENSIEADSNVFVIQRFLTLPLQFDIVFISNTNSRFISTNQILNYADKLSHSFDSEFSILSDNFDQKFEETFKLKQAGFNEQKIEMAMVALSNLIGGIGYFHGRNRVYHESKDLNKNDWIYHKQYYTLTTATPSRGYFPRGFLWDEGFHQLIISRFDKEISKDILWHWLHLTHENGWIPREQILGSEAESRVPQEFITQFQNHANPPTIYLAIESIADQGSLSASDLVFLKRALGQLTNNFLWFMKTQKGVEKNTFRWRGSTDSHTLASGLDDYPRTSNRTKYEENIDLISWMIMSAHALDKIASILERYDLYQFKVIEETLISNLQERYWNYKTNAYCDYDNLNGQHVEHIGYITLFPLLFGLIQNDSPRLAATLSYLENDTLLRTPFGIPSLSRSDPDFGKDQNYWRGPIWININYLTLRALYKYYINVDGPYRERAQLIYHSLRNSLIENVFRVYMKQGTIFENYNAISGRGLGQNPFTGWTSLIVLIMADIY